VYKDGWGVSFVRGREGRRDGICDFVEGDES